MCRTCNAPYELSYPLGLFARATAHVQNHIVRSKREAVEESVREFALRVGGHIAVFLGCLERFALSQTGKGEKK